MKPKKRIRITCECGHIKASHNSINLNTFNEFCNICERDAYNSGYFCFNYKADNLGFLQRKYEAKAR